MKSFCVCVDNEHMIAELASHLTQDECDLLGISDIQSLFEDFDPDFMLGPATLRFRMINVMISM